MTEVKQDIPEVAIVPNWKDQIEFNFSRITARRVADLDKAIKAVNVNASAEIYALIITKCPPEWGDPNDPDTYKDLPFFQVFNELIGVMGEAAKKGSKR